jgi:hypothetical protein
MVPVAILGMKLDPDSLHAIVKLMVMMTHCHEVVVESCYLYCFAMQKVLMGAPPAEAYQ